MFRKLVKNRKAQNTAEYALLISLVVAGIIAMQTYAQRALQGRIRDASQFLTDKTNTLGTTAQYEPDYLFTNYEIDRDDTETKKLGNGFVEQAMDSTRNRMGKQVFNYTVPKIPLQGPQ